jgi:hypothetical protein
MQQLTTPPWQPATVRILSTYCLMHSLHAYVQTHAHTVLNPNQACYNTSAEQILPVDQVFGFLENLTVSRVVTTLTAR